jgi:hypothetical protein
MEETMRSSNHLAIATTLLAACCSISTLCAEVYRCVKNDGHISYQQIRCHQDSKPMAINHSRTGWSGLRTGEQALLGDYRKRDAVQKQKPQADILKTDGKTEACWTRKTQLDAVKAKLRRGYNIREGEKLHQQRSDHEGYLRQYCSR